MENRFGFRDLVLSVLLIAILVTLWVSMMQNDRQWDKLREISDQSTSNEQDLIKIERALASGVAVTTEPSGATASAEQAPNHRTAFDWINKVEARPDYARGDWFVENLPAHVPKLTPGLYQDIYAQYVVNRVEESMLYRDPYTLDFMPLLATSWKSEDNRAAWQAYIDQRIKVPITQDDIVKESDYPSDKSDAEKNAYVQKRVAEGRNIEDVDHEDACPPAETITFDLRRGVQFSDGEPFTADDVKFTFDFINDPKIDDPRDRSSLDRVKSVTKIDDYHVAIAMREPYFDSLFLVSSVSIMPKHFYSKFTPDQFNNSVGLLLGEGPYKMQDPQGWTPNGNKIVLLRNDRYWGDAPPFDQIIFYQVEEEAVATTMFKNGELDYITQLVPEQYRALLQDKEVVARSQHLAYDYPLFGYNYIGWNEKRNGQPTVFADKRVRQAMTMLIDRQAICDNILLGLGKPAYGPFAPSNPQHDPNLKPMPFDPDKAKQILTSLGFSDRSGTGILSNEAGLELRFKLTYNSKISTYQRMVLMVKDELAKAGVDCEPDPEDWPIMMKKMDDRDFDALTMGWSTVIEDDLYQMFHSSQIAGDADDFVSYANPELDAAIVKARTELDRDKRMPLWQQCERIIADDQPYTFLYNRQELMFADKRIQNIEPSKLGLNYVELFVQPMPWYVPASQRKWTK